MTRVPLLLSAGEASGDMYAAQLAAALRRRADVALFGMGGEKMRAAGVELVADYSQVAVVGITEVIRRLPSLRAAMKNLVDQAAARKPPLAVVVDFPGFHLRLARKLRRLGVRNVYFVCPQFWAWRPWRARIVRRRFARALCIFPFEEKFFGDAGVPVNFIGHPLVGEVKPALSREEFAAQHGLDAAARLIAVLPGSRRGEIFYHVPIVVEALGRIRGRCREKCEVTVGIAPGLDAARLKPKFPEELKVKIIEGQTYDLLAAADVAIVSSGTATVETALLGTPMVVVYRLSPLTAFLARPLVHTPFYSMVNLIAGRKVVPELIQDDFTPDRLAAETLELLSSDEKRAEMRRGLAEVRQSLGPPGAVERAAEIIAGML